MIKSPSKAAAAVVVSLLLALPAAAQQKAGAAGKALIQQMVAMKGQGAPAIKAYKEALSNGDAQVRRAAIQLLVKEAGKPAIPDLKTMLADSDEWVVIAAGIGLLDLGEHPMPEIQQALKHDHMDVRMELAEHIGEFDHTAYLTHVGSMISDPEPKVRLASVRAMQAISSKDSLQPLMAATADAERGVATLAIQALESLGDPRALQRLTRMANTEDLALKRAVAHAVVVLGGASSHAELTTKLLADEDVGVRRSILNGMREQPDEAALSILSGRLDKLPTTGDRHAAVLVYKATESENSHGPLVKLIADPEARVRSSAVLAAGQKNVDALMDAVVTRVEDKEAQVRSSVAYALGHEGREASVPHLTKLSKDPSGDVRASAVQSAATVGTEGALKIVLAALGDSESYVAIQAVRSLGKFEQEAALEKLRELAKHSDLQVRLSAISGLGMRKDKGSVPMLKELAKEPVEVVRRAARSALDQIGE
ncbi:hypothetical protein ABI59_03965 [Acidobacteria bacterium Mor1]|nr:hypothetical protein ABI59_03965 [Acidobacteria bacterium Mor1]